MKMLKTFYSNLSNNKKYLILTYLIVFVDGVLSFFFIPKILNLIGESDFGYWLFLFTVANFFLSFDGGLSGYFLSKLRTDNDELTKILIYSIIKLTKFLIVPIFFILFIVSNISDSVYYLLIIELSLIVYLQISNNLYDSLLVGQKREVESKFIILLSSLFSVLVLSLLIYFDYDSIDIISISILSRFIFSNVCYMKNVKEDLSDSLDFSSFIKEFKRNVFEGYKIGLKNKFLSAFNSQGYIIIVGLSGNLLLLSNINLVSRFVNIVSTVFERLNPFLLQILIDKKKSNYILSKKVIALLNIVFIVSMIFVSYLNLLFLTIWLPGIEFEVDLILFVTLFILSGMLSNVSSYMLLSLNDFVFSSKVIQIELYLKLICLFLLFINFKFYFITMTILSFVFFNYYLSKRNLYIEAINYSAR